MDVETVNFLIDRVHMAPFGSVWAQFGSVWVRLGLSGAFVNAPCFPMEPERKQTK